jgi:signal transduction histidine kinase
LPEAHIDKAKVKIVLSNLISNALKFTTQGIILVRTDVMANVIQISVRDTGTGISREQIPRLFQKFARGGSVLGSFDQEGTGLGLFISRLIVEAHGGKMGVDSREGEGSVFFFTLPLG